MGPLMGIGEIGPDGRRGGQLERELEMWESAVKGKRKGYRDKIKARESGVSDAVNGEDGQDDERGEPDMKRARMDVDDSAEASQRHANGNGNAMPPPRQQRLNLSLGRANGSHQHALPQELADDEPLEDDVDGEDDADGDETESVDDDEVDEGDGDDELPEDAGGDDYGPHEQLRHEALLNGSGAVEIVSGSEDESD